MSDYIDTALLVLILGMWAFTLRQQRRGAVHRENPEVAGFLDAVGVDVPEGPPTAIVGGDGPPHVTDEVWAAIKSHFDRFDQYLGVVKLQDNLEDQVRKKKLERLAEPTPEPFVPERRYFGPIEGQEMEYCHGVGQLVVHRKTCPRAPHEDRRRYIWAFDAAQLGEWTDAEPGRWRECRVCRPFTAGRSGEATTEEASDEVRAATS